MANPKPKNAVVGMEFSGHRIRIAAGFRTGGGDPESYTLRCDEMVIPEAESYLPTALPPISVLAPAFKPTLARLGISGGRAAIAVGPPHMVLRHFVGTSDQVRTDLDQAMERSLSYVQYGLGERAAGEHLHELGDGRVHGLLGISSMSTIVPLADCLKQFALNVTVIEPALTSLVRLATVAGRFEGQETFIVWVDSATIEIGLVSGGKILFSHHTSSTAPMGPQPDDSDPASSIESSDLCRQLERMSRHYMRAFDAPKPVQDVLLCGASNLISTITPVLENSAGLRTRTLKMDDSTIAALGVAGDGLVGNESHLAAIGAFAALRTNDDGIVGPNLASAPQDKRGPQFEALVRALIIPTLVAAAIWGLAFLGQAHLEAKVAKLRIEVEHPSFVEASYRELKIELIIIEQRTARLAELAESNQYRHWKELMETIRISVPDRLWLTRTRLSADGNLSVEGATYDESLIYEFANNIEGSPIFASASIMTETSSRRENAIIQEFSIECVLMEDFSLSDASDL